MLEPSRWQRLAMAIAQISRPRTLGLGALGAAGLAVAGPLWAETAAPRDALTPLAQAEETAPDYNPYLYLDWLPAWQLPPGMQPARPTACSGAFVSPPRDYPDADLPPETAPLRATADASEWLDDGTARLRGSVHVTQGYRQLFADQVDVNRNESTARLRGAIEIREPNLLVRGRAAEIQTDSQAAEIEDATYVIHDQFVHGSASFASREASGELILTNGNYTRCEPGNVVWQMRGGEIHIDNVERQGVARNVRLEILDVPLFYFPYLRFPVGSERLSGLLFPSISNSDENGWDVAIPYYWNIAPQMDATIVPRYIQYRGTGAEVEVRHLSQLFNSELRAAGLPDDKGGDDEDAQDLIRQGFPEDLVLPAKGEDRWLVNFEQQGTAGTFWRTNIDYAKVSDPDYFRDLDTANLSVSAETSLNQRADVSLFNENWTATLRAQDYQQLVKDRFDTYRQLPRLDVDGNYRWGDWALSLDHEVTRWDHDDEQTIRFIADVGDPDSITELSRNFVNADRLRLDYELEWDKQWLWGYFTPGIAARYLGYEIDDQFLNPEASDSPEASAGQFTLDSGLFFERDASVFGFDLVQTLEPRFFTLVSSKADQGDFTNVSTSPGDGGNDLLFDTSLFTFSYDQLFRDSRFTGNDRIDDTDRVALGLTTRIIDPVSGRDLFALSGGQIFYLEDRETTLTGIVEEAPRSEFAARLESRPIQSMRISSELIYDDDEGELNRGNVSLRYLDNDYRLFNLGYRYLRRNEVLDLNGELISGSIDQVDASMVLPVSPTTALLARANYDLTFDRELEYVAGVEYDSCCYMVRLAWRRTLDNDLADVVSPEELEFDEGVYIEFQLKGLASLGTTVTRMLSQGIPNFDQREQLKQ
ncbi:LPS-assembly protein LptD [Microbulbifer guangxiensis]|uniref:LPS-assembly protein LptD n=1 Tax=Microbulbifer guangxiensis TaxID=2904249 RepID=UPI001F22CC79|nr:LPS-assembly protein LptD [Microbulbifer guangxiensis]